MKQIDTLFQERFQTFMKEMRRYFKYIFNDHLLFVMIFGGGAAVYYYSQWVKTLSSKFPVGIVMAVILGLIVTWSPVITLLKKADAIFLLPLEERLNNYFQKGMRFSFIIQTYILLLVLAAFMPMYSKVKGSGFTSFITLFIIIAALKSWNLKLHWQMLKVNNQSSFFTDGLIRYAMNGILLYFCIEKASLWFIGAMLLIMIAFTLYVNSIAKNKMLKWDILIDQESSRMQAFYRLANMFTDVPHIKGSVKRRRWLDPLITGAYAKEMPYQYLYKRTLSRTNEFSGLIIRLSLISSLFIFFSNNLYVNLGIGLLFIYLTGFQLIPLLRRHDTKIWMRLYPLSAKLKEQAFLYVLLRVLACQGLLFGLAAVLSGKFLNGAWTALTGIVFAFLFTKVYAPKRILKMQRYEK